MAVKTQGTQLFAIDPADCSVITVECTTGLTGLGAPREQIETTCLDADVRTYVGGLATPGQLTVGLNFDPSIASHYRLYEMWRDNVDFKFAIGLGPETDVPTTSSGCDFDYPTTRTFIEAEGYIVDFPLEIALNAVITSSIPFQLSGEYTIFRKVP